MEHVSITVFPAPGDEPAQFRPQTFSQPVSPSETIRHVFQTIASKLSLLAAEVELEEAHTRPFSAPATFTIADSTASIEALCRHGGKFSPPVDSPLTYELDWRSIVRETLGRRLFFRIDPPILSVSSSVAPASARDPVPHGHADVSPASVASACIGTSINQLPPTLPLPKSNFNSNLLSGGSEAGRPTGTAKAAAAADASVLASESDEDDDLAYTAMNSLYSTGRGFLRSAADVIQGKRPLKHEEDLPFAPLPLPQRMETGCSNLGNTCFMNSALQCLRAVQPLTAYLLDPAHVAADLNVSNPLGSGGRIARSYANLLREMQSGRHAAVAPKRLKDAIGHFQPRFRGYGQHDSQELLTFLLDGVHEDLNRVVVKPATEKVEIKPGESVATAVREATRRHLMRNDSIVADTFHFMLVNRLRCSVCGHVAENVDPAAMLSLPLPVRNEREVDFLVSNGAGAFVAATVTVDLDAGLPAAIERALDAIAPAVISPPSPDALVALLVERYDEVPKLMASLQRISRIHTYLTPKVLLVSAPGTGRIVVALPQSTATRSYDRCVMLPAVFRLPEDVIVSAPLPAPVAENDVVLTAEDASLDPAATATSALPAAEPHRSVPAARLAERCLDALLPLSIRAKAQPSALSAAGPASGLSFADAVSSAIETPPDFVPALEAYRVIRTSSFYGFSSYGQARADFVPVRPDEAVTLPADARTPLVIRCSLPKTRRCLSVEQAAGMALEVRQPAASRAHQSLSLDDCVREFEAEEFLSGTEQWYCPCCKTHVDAYKTMGLHSASLPPVLIVHLKRFRTGGYLSYGSRDKIDTLVDYPISGFRPRTLDGDAAEYELFAVSEHLGGAHGGHYVATARSLHTGQWYDFNDSSARASRGCPVTAQAYMLLYARSDLLKHWYDAQRAAVSATAPPPAADVLDLD
jgi:ubiquitin C-terminal hydrolase